MAIFKNQLWSRFVTVAAPFFKSPLRRRALGALVLLVVLLGSVNGLNVVISYVGNAFMTALEERHTSLFYFFGLALAGVFLIATVMAVFARYTEERLGLLWREWLTHRVLDRYLADRTYRRIAEREDIDNPDQRISEDVKTFTTSTLSFLIMLFNGVLTLLAFSAILWSITPWLFLTAILYALTGSFGTLLLGRRLVGFDNLQLRKEADFRYALGRFREHAGAVAQLGGEAEERSRLSQKVRALVENFRNIIGINRQVGFFINAYNYMTQIIPAVVVAPLFIRGDVKFGTVTQAAMAFTQVLGAFSLIIVQFQQISAYAAVIGRLGALWQATEPVPQEKAPTGPKIEAVPSARHVVYQGLTLRTPNEGRLLVRDLSLEVPEGKRVVVRGLSGSGKSALCMATAGLWDEGQGRIFSPGPGEVMFLPQEAYTPNGSLRDLLLYAANREGVTEEQILAALREVGLESLVDRVGGLDVERDWSNFLSEGERQALAFARLMLINPRFAFMDGAAERLDTERMHRLYTSLARTSITYISVGDDPDLLRYHDLVLELRGDGEWQVGPAQPATNGYHTEAPVESAAH